MGFLIKFLLFFIAIYLLLKGLVAFLTVGKKSKRSKTYRQNQKARPRPAETQEDRIIEFQKKKFESSEVEDAQFLEIKKPENKSN